MQVLTRSQLQRFETVLYSLLLLLLPTQLGKHFWPEFSVLNGIRVDFLSPTVYVTDILVFLLFTVWLLRKVLSLRSNVRRQKQTSPPAQFRQKQLYQLFANTLIRRLQVHRKTLLFLLGAVFLLSTVLLSENKAGGLYNFLKFLEVSFVAFYTASVVPSRFSFEKLTALLAIGVIGESLLAAAHYANQGSIGGIFYLFGERSFTAGTPGIANAAINGELIMRAYGTFPHPNVLAGYLVVSMTLIFFFLFQSIDRLQKVLAGTAVLFGTAALLFTLSRVAIAVWLLFLAVVLFWQTAGVIRDRSKQGMLLMVLAVVLLIGGAAAFWQTLAPRFLQTAFTEEAVVYRSLLHDAAVAMIAGNPFTGVGLGNFLPSVALLQSPLSVGLYLQPVHNIFLLIAAETGVVGLLFFVGVLLAAYHRLFKMITGRGRYYRTGTALIVVLTMMVVLGLFDHYWLTLQQGQLLFALILGLSFHQTPESFKLGEPKITRK